MKPRGLSLETFPVVTYTDTAKQRSYYYRERYRFDSEQARLIRVRIPGKPASHSRGNRPPSGAKRRWVVIRSVMVAGLARNTQGASQVYKDVDQIWISIADQEPIHRLLANKERYELLWNGKSLDTVRISPR